MSLVRNVSTNVFYSTGSLHNITDCNLNSKELMANGHTWEKKEITITDWM